LGNGVQAFWRFLVLLAPPIVIRVEGHILGKTLMMLAACAVFSGALSSRWYLSAAVAAVEGRESEAGINRVNTLARRIKDAYGTFPPRGIKSLETLVIMSLFLTMTSAWFLAETGRWGTMGGVVKWDSYRLVFVPASFGDAAGAVGALEMSNWLTLGVAGMVLSFVVGMLVNPLVAIIHALTYLKARQLGGEGIDDVALRADEK
jgi:hypothetical protein